MSTYTTSRPRMLRDPARGYVGGICAGIARGLQVPALVVRLAAILALLVCTSVTIVAYLAAWFFMDTREDAVRAEWRHPRRY
jgi:phage shock protein C